MKITSYNPAAAGSAPFFRALVVYRCQVYSVKGADAVIQSARHLISPTLILIYFHSIRMHKGNMCTV